MLFTSPEKFIYERTYFISELAVERRRRRGGCTLYTAAGIRVGGLALVDCETVAG